MEHRSNQREALRYPLTLHSNRFGNTPATTRDISPDGMLVDVGDAALPLYAQVTLTIDVDRVRYRVDALVVHSSRAGVGLMYGDTDTGRALHAALRQVTHAPHAGTRVPFWLTSKEEHSRHRSKSP